MATQSETEQFALPPASILRIHLLGPPDVEGMGRPLTIPRRQTRALLYRLGNRLQPVPREHLCSLFWPDTPEITARRNLSHLLTHLRRALPTPEVLLIAEDHVALNPDLAWSDTVVFEQLCTTQETQRRSATLQQAVGLYRGTFLAGFSLPAGPEFEIWAALERSAWERLYLETLASLVEKKMVQGNYQAAIDHAQHYLAIDDLAEEMHRRLITLYAASGDRSAALRQFERCTVALERELGVSPLPQTRAAYEAVIAGRVPSPPQVAPAEWMTLPSLDAPLVGRNHEMHRLEQAYASAQLSQGKFVLILGESGVGKSRLMQEFVANLAGEATVVVGGGHEAERDLPYWPLVEALHPHLQTTINQVMAGFEPLNLAPLAGLWPDLQSILPRVPLLEPSQERARLFQALVHFLLTLASQRRPLILCLDNLHWADETTLAWLGYLARQLIHTPLMVLGAYRSEQATTVAALRTELMRLGLLEEISLEGLPQHEILRLVRRLSGQKYGGERFSQRLHQETDGNLFFLLETLRAMFEAGALWQDETGWTFEGVDETNEDYRKLPLPESVGEAIQTRLGYLSAQGRQILEAGAVIGCRFRFDLLRTASGRREPEVVEALDELLARHMIVENDDGYRFKHNLIRTAVYRNLSYGRRRLLHRRAAETLEKVRPDDAAILSWHFEQAQEPGKAARYALQAGLAAKTVFAYAKARTLFSRALVLLQQEAKFLQEPEAITANRHLRIQALARRGWALRLLGDMTAYVRDSQEVARLARQLDDNRTLAHLCWREAYTHRWFCRYPEARAAAEEGLNLSQAITGDSLLAAMCRREVGLAAREMGDYRPAQASLEQALQLFITLNEIVGEIHTLGNLSTLYTRLGEYEQAIKLARQALVRCEEAELPFERRLSLADLGAAVIQVGDKDLARQCFLESLAIARQIADRTMEIFCLGHLGWLCLKLKRPAQALEYLQTALRLAENIDSRTEQSWLWSGLAEAHRLTDALDLALEHVRRALESAQINGRVYDRDLACQILVKLE